MTMKNLEFPTSAAVRTVALLPLLTAVLALPLSAAAYNIQYNSDKTQATVYCDNGGVAGTLYWNGSTWTTGAGMSGNDVDALARRLVASSGSACK